MLRLLIVVSCFRAWTVGVWASVVSAHGLQSAGSVVVAHGLSCSAACRIFPNQESNLSPASAGRFSSTMPPADKNFKLSAF